MREHIRESTRLHINGANAKLKALLAFENLTGRRGGGGGGVKRWSLRRGSKDDIERPSADDNPTSSGKRDFDHVLMSHSSERHASGGH